MQISCSLSCHIMHALHLPKNRINTVQNHATRLPEGAPASRILISPIFNLTHLQRSHNVQRSSTFQSTPSHLSDFPTPRAFQQLHLTSDNSEYLRPPSPQTVFAQQTIFFAFFGSASFYFPLYLHLLKPSEYMQRCLSASKNFLAPLSTTERADWAIVIVPLAS